MLSYCVVKELRFQVIWILAKKNFHVKTFPEKNQSINRRQQATIACFAESAAKENHACFGKKVFSFKLLSRILLVFLHTQRSNFRKFTKKHRRKVTRTHQNHWTYWTSCWWKNLSFSFGWGGEWGSVISEWPLIPRETVLGVINVLRKQKSWDFGPVPTLCQMP